VNPASILWIVFRASLLSTGGFGNVPTLHADVVGGKFATESTFAESLAVGQISPGPNGLWVVSLGYLLGGWGGAAAATFAILFPPIVVVWVDRFYSRVQHHSAVDGFVRGLALAVVGIFVLVMFRLLWTSRTDALGIACAVAACAAGLTRKIPVLVVITAASVIGILSTR
jgi:chromate transporter